MNIWLNAQGSNKSFSLHFYFAKIMLSSFCGFCKWLWCGKSWLGKIIELIPDTHYDSNKMEKWVAVLGQLAFKGCWFFHYFRDEGSKQDLFPINFIFKRPPNLNITLPFDGKQLNWAEKTWNINFQTSFFFVFLFRSGNPECHFYHFNFWLFDFV